MTNEENRAPCSPTSVAGEERELHVTGMSWTIPPLWRGQTVAVVGAGPSATPEALARAAGLPTIVANAAVRLLPHADIMVSIDGNWPAEGERFEGLIVVGVPGLPRGYYAGVSYERVEMGPGHVVDLRNNGLMAMRIAADAGASKIVVIGMDPESYAAINAPWGFAEVYPIAFAATVAQLRAAGVEVEIIASACGAA